MQGHPSDSPQRSKKAWVAKVVSKTLGGGGSTHAGGERRHATRRHPKESDNGTLGLGLRCGGVVVGLCEFDTPSGGRQTNAPMGGGTTDGNRRHRTGDWTVCQPSWHAVVFSASFCGGGPLHNQVWIGCQKLVHRKGFDARLVQRQRLQVWQAAQGHHRVAGHTALHTHITQGGAGEDTGAGQV